MTGVPALVVVLVLVAALPGIAAAVLLVDPRRNEGLLVEAPGAALSRGVACGLATWLLGSGLVARTVGLSAVSAWVWTGVVAVASVLVLALPRHRPALRALLPDAGLAAATVGVVAVTYLPLAVLVLQTTWAPLDSTPWYYWGLAEQVADAGQVPASSVEWGTTTGFLDDYQLFSTGTAMLLLQHGRDAVDVLQVVTLGAALLLGWGAAALAAALGAGRVGALLAVPLAIGTGIGPIRLTSYRPEGFALGLGLLLVALCIDWLRNGRAGSLVAAGLVAATLSQVHGIAALAAGVLATAAALAVRGPSGWRTHVRRCLTALVVLGGAVVVTGIVLRGASGTAHLASIPDQGGTDDPTWAFYRAARGARTSVSPLTNSEMALTAVERMYGASAPWLVPLAVVASALVVLAVARRDRAARELVAFGLLGLTGMALMGSVFALGWDSYVPRRTGAQRITNETSLLVGPWLATALVTAVRQVLRAQPRTGPRREPLTLLVLVALLSAGGLAGTVPAAAAREGNRPAREDLATVRSLGISADDVVLGNAYTEGFIPRVTGGIGLLDGRAPYTFPDLLERATTVLRQARRFYARPERNWDFLVENDVDWVLVSARRSYALGSQSVFRVPRVTRALDRCPGLERVHAGKALHAYRVRPTAPDTNGCTRAPAA